MLNIGWLYARKIVLGASSLAKPALIVSDLGDGLGDIQVVDQLVLTDPLSNTMQLLWAFIELGVPPLEGRLFGLTILERKQ